MNRGLLAQLQSAEAARSQYQAQRDGLERRNVDLERRSIDLNDRVNELTAAVTVLVAAVVSGWAAWRKLDAVDIIEVLKTRD